MDIRDLEGKSIKIKWLQPIELDITTGIDKNDEPVFDKEYFNKEETCKVDVFGIDEREGEYFLDFQFGDGSVATAINTNLFAIEEIE